MEEKNYKPSLFFFPSGLTSCIPSTCTGAGDDALLLNTLLGVGRAVAGGRRRTLH